MKYKELLEGYLAAREWTDELSVDEENGAVQLDTGISLGEQSGRLIVEAYEQTDLVDVFIYFKGFSCKEAKVGEMLTLMNSIHLRSRLGRFELLPDGVARWYHRVDFEGSSPTPTSIHQMVQPGWNIAERWADVLAAVALTKQSAEEALEEFEEVERQREAQQEEAEGDGPREL
jgi:hypothetical protein